MDFNLVPGGTGELSVWVGGQKVADKGDPVKQIVERARTVLK